MRVGRRAVPAPKAPGAARRGPHPSRQRIALMDKCRQMLVGRKMLVAKDCHHWSLRSDLAHAGGVAKGVEQRGMFILYAGAQLVGVFGLEVDVLGEGPPC